MMLLVHAPCSFGVVLGANWIELFQTPTKQIREANRGTFSLRAMSAMM